MLSGRLGPAAATHCHNQVLPGVNDSQVLVLAGGDKEAPVVVPADIVDEVGVQVIQGQERLPSAHVPEDDDVVAPCRKEGELGKGQNEASVSLA